MSHEVQREQALGGAYIGGAQVIRERRCVNRRVSGAIGDVSDRRTGEIESRQVGQGRGTSGAGGAVNERLVTLGDNVVAGRFGDDGVELGPGGDVHASLGDPAGLEAAGGADVEIGKGIGGEVLIGGPAGLGGGDRGEEVVGMAEVVGEDEAEALEEVAAGGGDVEGGTVTVLDEIAEDGEVEWAGDGGVLLRDGGGDGGGEEEEKEEEREA